MTDPTPFELNTAFTATAELELTRAEPAEDVEKED